MKIGIASTGPDLNSQIDIRFARAPYFLVVDSETNEFKVVKNPYVMGRGIGYAAAELLANHGAEVVITGSVGPNAYNALLRLGIKIYIATGIVKDALDKLRNHQLAEIRSPVAGPGYGAGRGLGLGRGQGFGRRGGF